MKGVDIAYVTYLQNFTGNTDRNSVVSHWFPGIKARYVRVQPTSWSGLTNCLRMEIYGCHNETGTPEAQSSLNFPLTKVLISPSRFSSNLSSISKYFEHEQLWTLKHLNALSCDLFSLATPTHTSYLLYLVLSTFLFNFPCFFINITSSNRK